MLQEPQLSPYDLQFSVFGIPVRVAWGFWILAAVLGWGSSQGADLFFAETENGSPGALILLLVWTAALLLSILVHELGHSLAHRYYGMDSRIVLYHFGGLAIPGSFTAWNAARKRSTERPIDLILISAAGPAAQMLLGVAVIGLANLASIDAGFNGVRLTAEPDQSAAVYVFVESLIYVSIWWALLNLLPILPLDGGRIMQEVMRLLRVPNALQSAAVVSMIAAAAMALFMFQRQQPGMGLLFLSFAASNYQQYQAGGIGRY